MAIFGGPVFPKNDLVLALDAGDVSSYPGSGTSWNDLSGRGNTGTFVNGPTFSTDKGGVISFAGTTQHITVPDSNDWTNTDLTIDIWFNRAASWAAAWYADALVSHDVGNGSVSKWIYSYDSSKSKPIFHINNPSTGANVVVESSSTVSITLSVWYNFLITKSGNTYTFYSNNVSLGTATNSSLIPNASAPLRIGTGEAGGNYFNGKIAAVKMYSRALSSSEISQNFNALRVRFGV